MGLIAITLLVASMVFNFYSWAYRPDITLMPLQALLQEQPKSILFDRITLILHLCFLLSLAGVIIKMSAYVRGFDQVVDAILKAQEETAVEANTTDRPEEAAEDREC